MSEKRKIFIIIGTRPEAIKMCPLINYLEQYSNFKVIVCVTGQHREMLDQVLNLFGVQPDYDLNIMAKNQSLSEITSKILMGLDAILSQIQPNLVLVHGDTSTALAGALASYYHKIALGHVEAGLRTGNIYSPWPEEINRKLISSLAMFHFAPTQAAKENLILENVKIDRIFVTGNSVIDALFEMQKKITFLRQSDKKPFTSLGSIDFDRRVILVTGHRRENFGQGFENICTALRKIASRFNDVQIVYPVHLNPKVRQPVELALSNFPNIVLLEPLEYLPFVELMSHCELILTDSGGIQEEAPALGIPVLVMREETERPEGVAAGTIKLVGSDAMQIFAETEKLLTNPLEYAAMRNAINPYGDGNTCEKIANILVQHYEK